MSTAWMAPVVLLTEPRSALVRRLLRRSIVPLLAFVVAGAPGTGYAGLFNETWVRVTVWTVGSLGLLLFLVAIANVIRNKRVILVMMPTGSIEWPRSYQEIWLRRRQDYVVGSTIMVEPAAHLLSATSAPRVTLVGDDSQIKNVPLYGRRTGDWIAEANAAMKGRGVKLKMVGKAPIPTSLDEPAPDES